MKVEFEKALSFENEDTKEITVVFVGDIVEADCNLLGNVITPVKGIVTHIEPDGMAIDYSKEYQSRIANIELDQVKNIRVICSHIQSKASKQIWFLGLGNFSEIYT